MPSDTGGSYWVNAGNAQIRRQQENIQKERQRIEQVVQLNRELQENNKTKQSQIDELTLKLNELVTMVKTQTNVIEELKRQNHNLQNIVNAMETKEELQPSLNLFKQRS